MATALSAQLATDYSPPRTALPPEVDPQTLVLIYEHLQVRAQAGTMDGLFFIMTLVALGGALLALLLPTQGHASHPTPHRDPSPRPHPETPAYSQIRRKGPAVAFG